MCSLPLVRNKRANTSAFSVWLGAGREADFRVSIESGKLGKIVCPRDRTNAAAVVEDKEVSLQEELS